MLPGSVVRRHIQLHGRTRCEARPNEQAASFTGQGVASRADWLAARAGN